MRLDAEVCEQCGARGVRADSTWQRLRRWFTYGGGMSSAYVCPRCGAAWSSGSWYVLHAPSRWSRWWRLPADLLQAVRSERTWEPVPRLYAIVGMAAAVPAAIVATVVRRRLAWAWPLLAAVGAASTTFVASIASGFGGGRALRAIARVVAPQRAIRAEFAREHQLIRRDAAGWSLLMPDAWEGRVALEGAGWRVLAGGGRQMTSMSVVAESHAGPAALPWLRIEHDLEPLPPQLVAERAITTVVGHEQAATSELTGLDPRQDRDRIDTILAAARRRQREREQQLEGAWRDARVTVDGRAVPARTVVGDGVQAATFEHAHGGVTVVGAGLDLARIELVTTRDLEPLLDAMQQRRLTLLE